MAITSKVEDESEDKEMQQIADNFYRIKELQKQVIEIRESYKGLIKEVSKKLKEEETKG